MNRCPLVTVVITNFNYKNFVEQAIHSVVAQTYEAIECVVVDDASTDGSFEVILRCVEGLTRTGFRALRLGKNLGQMAAFKAGLENSSGPFVVFLDADDYLSPAFVETHVRAHLNVVRAAAFTASDTFTVDEAGTLREGTWYQFARHMDSHPEEPTLQIRPDALPRYEGNGLVYDNGPSEPQLAYRAPQRLGWPYSATSSFMFRRDVVALAMPENTEAVRICADYYLVQFASCASGSIIIKRSLGYYRVHQNNKFLGEKVTGGLPATRLSHTGSKFQAIDAALESHVSQQANLLLKALQPEFLKWFSTSEEVHVLAEEPHSEEVGVLAEEPHSEEVSVLAEEPHSEEVSVLAEEPQILKDSSAFYVPFDSLRYLTSRRYRRMYNAGASSTGRFNLLSFMTSRRYRRQYATRRKLHG